MVSYNQTLCVINAFGKTLTATNNVRNETNLLRKLGLPHEVVYTEPASKNEKPLPYMPRKFPIGKWKITGITPIDIEQPYLYPFFISTNAVQHVQTWELDENGGYLKPGNVVQLDSGYGIHYSTSPTTLGCIRVINEKDLRWLVEQLQQALKAGDVDFEVTE